MPSNWEQKFSQAIEWPGKFLQNGMHAQQDIPSQHRLLNAGGMAAGWWAMDKIRHIAFGYKMKREGEYEEVPIEDVPAPLRFLHKVIDWNPHSEAPDDQWKKIMYQTLPGAGAGIGATIGSIYAFQRNGREQGVAKLKGMNKLGLLDADYVAQHADSLPLRLAAAFFGTFSAASGLTYFYGASLNNAFMAANGAKMFNFTPGALAKGNVAPHKAAEAQMGSLENFMKAGKGDEWAKDFVVRVMQPMFGHELSSPAAQAKAIETLKGMEARYLQAYKTSTLPADKKAGAVAETLAQDLVKHLNLDISKATPGNANPFVHGLMSFMHKMGLTKEYKPGPQTKGKEIAPRYDALGASAAFVAAGLLASNSASASTPAIAGDGASLTDSSGSGLHTRHAHPDAAGKTPAEYVADAMKLHNTNNNAQPPNWMKWIGDAQLAVFPTNRLYCAIGLTAGLMFAGNMAKIATGYGLDNKPVEAGKIPTYLKGMHGIVKDYNPTGFRPRDRWIKYGQAAVYSLGGLLGVKFMTDLAFKNVAEKNKDPHYLEDYLPRVSMHQGETWSWLAAASSIFGSASGLFNLPIPGLNYAVSLASRATSMQDRNFQLGETLGGFMSGASTTSFLRLREGMNYLCHYAVDNPAETPAQIEFLAYTMLGPLFKDKLTVEHIQHFTDAVHEVRDRYWQEGGIPKEKRKEALATMREVFTGAGLEVLLMNMGLNPGTIIFDKLNGMTGKIGNLSAIDKVHAEQEKYLHMLDEHLNTYVKEGLVSEGRAQWVRAGMEAAKHGQPQPALLPSGDEVLPSAQPSMTPSAEQPEQAHFADKAPRKNNIQTLIQKAEKPGSWSENAQLSRENIAPALMGG